MPRGPDFMKHGVEYMPLPISGLSSFWTVSEIHVLPIV